MKNHRPAWFLFIVLFSYHNSISQWLQTNGPEGGIVYSLAVKANKTFAGTYRTGIFLSSDNCQTWLPVNSGLTHLTIRSLAVNGGLLFAGSFGGGVFLSSDDGATWTPVNAGLTNKNVYTLAVSGANLFAATDWGVHLSANNGQQWSLRNAGLEMKQVYSMAVKGNTLFAGVLGEGVFRSSNQGQNWTQSNSGLTNLNVNALEVLGSKVFAGTQAGVFRSGNDGQTWEPVNTGLTDLNICCMTDDGVNLFAGSWEGNIFLSTDQGSSWTPAYAGAENFHLKILVFNGSFLLAGTHGKGVFQSVDDGQSWNPVNRGLIGVTVNALLVEGSQIFAGAWPGGVYYSPDKGNSWGQIEEGLTDTYIHALVRYYEQVYAATNYGGVFLTGSNGQTWTDVGTGLTNPSINCLAENGSMLFAGSWGGGVYQYSEMDRIWSEVNTGLSSKFILALAGSGDRLYAGTAGSGVFFTESKGQNWTELNSGLANPYVYSLAVMGSDLFAGTWGGGVFHFSNQSLQLEAVNAGLSDLKIRRLAAVRGNLFAGTWGKGLFLSTDKGMTWADVSTGLQDTSVYSLASSGNELFLGLESGVWHRPLAEMITLEDQVLTVTHTGDSGPGSLRQALTDANEHAGADTVRFAVPETDDGFSEGGIWSIRPYYGLPRITDGPLVIDGFSQAVFMGEETNPFGPEIEINGSNTGDANGLWIAAPNVEIIGLAVNRFGHSGIVIEGGDNGRISGCYIGTDARGEEAAGNGGSGIYFYGNTRNYRIDTHNGTFPGNLISGNAQSGILLNQTCFSIVISGNIIGLNRTGEGVLGNTMQGISLAGDCGFNEISGNWISGNGNDGIYLYDSNQNTVSYNLIGTNGEFDPGLGNQSDGVSLSYSAGNVLEGNLICNNGADGVRQEGESAVHNRITLNSIWNNAGRGIHNTFSAAEGISAPQIMEIAPDIVNGLAAPGHRIEIYTDDDGQGKIYLASVEADASGEFSFNPSGQDLLSHFTAVAMNDSGSTSEFSLPVKTDVEDVEGQGIPEVFSLKQNYPNPFNPVTTIAFELPAREMVNLEVLDMLGRTVTVLLNEVKGPGRHDIKLDASFLETGVYVCRLTAGAFIANKKLIVMK